MSACKLHFRQLGFLLAILFWSCDSIPRDNVLDPKNPDSIAPQKVMIEAFVNTGNPEYVNETALQALDSLAERYDGRVVIAEYHRNTRDFTDPYNLEKNELLYQQYVRAFDGVKGVPDIFINGTRQRVQGASTVAFSLLRLETALADEVTANTYFSLGITTEMEDSHIIPVVRIARLGRHEAEEVMLKAVIVRNLGESLLSRVVRESVESHVIRTLNPGEILTVRMPGMDDEAGLERNLIVYEADSETGEIFQCRTVPLF